MYAQDRPYASRCRFVCSVGSYVCTPYVCTPNAFSASFEPTRRPYFDAFLLILGLSLLDVTWACSQSQLGPYVRSPHPSHLFPWSRSCCLPSPPDDVSFAVTFISRASPSNVPYSVVLIFHFSFLIFIPDFLTVVSRITSVVFHTYIARRQKMSPLPSRTHTHTPRQNENVQ